MQRNNRFKLSPIAIAIGALGFAGAAFAEGDMMDPQAGGDAQTSMSAPTMADIDANGDGQISKDEATADAGVDADFGDLDVNEDGVLDEGEFAQFEIEDDPIDTPESSDGLGVDNDEALDTEESPIDYGFDY